MKNTDIGIPVQLQPLGYVAQKDYMSFTQSWLHGLSTMISYVTLCMSYLRGSCSVKVSTFCSSDTESLDEPAIISSMNSTALALKKQRCVKNTKHRISTNVQTFPLSYIGRRQTILPPSPRLLHSDNATMDKKVLKMKGNAIIHVRS